MSLTQTSPQRPSQRPRSLSTVHSPYRRNARRNVDDRRALAFVRRRAKWTGCHSGFAQWHVRTGQGQLSFPCALRSTNDCSSASFPPLCSFSLNSLIGTHTDPHQPSRGGLRPTQDSELSGGVDSISFECRTRWIGHSRLRRWNASRYSRSGHAQYRHHLFRRRRACYARLRRNSRWTRLEKFLGCRGEGRWSRADRYVCFWIEWWIVGYWILGAGGVSDF